jgi:hypothetical protein
MTTLRSLALVATLSLFGASHTQAQTATATPAAAFIHAVRSVCAPNAMGDLPLNPPSAAITTAGVELIDGGTDPEVRGAFHDMPVTINYGAVASATGQIVVGADEAGSCRVAAINVTAADVAAITSVLQAAGGDWHELSADAAAGSATFSGTIGLESAMIVILTPPAGSHWGKAGIMATVMNPAA